MKTNSSSALVRLLLLLAVLLAGLPALADGEAPAGQPASTASVEAVTSDALTASGSSAAAGDRPSEVQASVQAQPAGSDHIEAELESVPTDIEAAGALAAAESGAAVSEDPAAAPAPGMARVTFSLSSKKIPYAVQLANTELTCKAPCVLDVPAGENTFVFLTGRDLSSASRRTYSVGEEGLDLELTRPYSTARRVAGITFLTLGAGGLAVGALGIVMIAAACRSDQEAEDVEDALGLVLSDVVFLVYGIAFTVLGLAESVITGLIGAHYLRTSYAGIDRHEQQSRPKAVSSVIRESMTFGLVPVRGGGVAAMGFRF